MGRKFVPGSRVLVPALDVTATVTQEGAGLCDSRALVCFYIARVNFRPLRPPLGVRG